MGESVILLNALLSLRLLISLAFFSLGTPFGAQASVHDALQCGAGSHLFSPGGAYDFAARAFFMPLGDQVFQCVLVPIMVCIIFCSCAFFSQVDQYGP